MSYLKDREIWLSKVPTGNPPVGFFWKFIQNGKVVVRDSSGNDQMMIATNGNQAITGSLIVTGGITGTISSASYVQYSNVANKPTLVSGSSQVTFLGLSSIPSGIVSGSSQVAQFGYATTGSNGFNGSQSITGSLTVTGQVIAQTLNVQQVTSSIVYSSGSNIFGNNTGNIHRFTGSLQVSGSNHYLRGFISVNTTSTHGNLTVEQTTGESGITVNSSIAESPVLYLRDAGGAGYSTILTNNNLYINSSKIGIGTNNPGAKLHVTGTVEANGSLYRAVFGSTVQDADMTGLTGGNGSEVQIQSPSTTRGAFLTLGGGMASSEAMGGIAFYNSNNVDGKRNRAFIVGGQEGATTNEQGSYLSFGTVANAGSVPSERMRITSGGDVRIGDDSNPYLEIANGGSTDVLSGIRWMLGGSRVNYGGVEMAASSADNGYMIFKTRNSGTTAERMRITSGGNTVLGGNAGSGWSTASGRTTLEIYGSIYPSALHNSTSVGSSLSYNTYWDGTNWRFVQGGTSVIYIQDSEGHKFLHNSAGSAGASFTPTERMRITSGGNVGIGTASPGYKLDVNGDIRTNAILYTNDNGPSIYQNRINAGWNTIGDSIDLWINYEGYQNGLDYFRDFRVGNGKRGSAILFIDGSNGSSTFSGSLTVGKGITVSSDAFGNYFGKFGAASTPLLELREFTGDQTGTTLILRSSRPNSGNLYAHIQAFSDSSTQVFRVLANGVVDNLTGAYGSLSDVKLKENIVDATPKLEDLLKVKIRNYNLIGEENKQIGVIAQELEEIFPGLVSESEDFEEVETTDEEGITKKEKQSLGTTTKSVKYSIFIPMLIKAIQEQQTLIESLKSRIEILEQ